MQVSFIVYCGIEKLKENLKNDDTPPAQTRAVSTKPYNGFFRMHVDFPPAVLDYSWLCSNTANRPPVPRRKGLAAAA